MEMSSQTKRLWKLSESGPEVVYSGSDGSQILVEKGAKIKKYGESDIRIRVERDLGESHVPTHEHVFKDFEQKLSSNPAAADRLYEIIDSVYRGEDPDAFVDELVALECDAGRYPADVVVYLVQHMMIEQEINFGPGGRTSHYSPPRDLLKSCLRWIYSQEYDDLDEVNEAASAGSVHGKYRWTGEKLWTRPNW